MASFIRKDIFILLVTYITIQTASQPIEDSLTCGQLVLTEIHDEIEPEKVDLKINLDQSEQYLQKLQNDFRSYRISEVRILVEKAVVRICNRIKHNCMVIENTTNLEENENNHIIRLNQVICNIKNTSCTAPKNCQDFSLEENDFGKLYQDSDCNDCRFPSISIPLGQPRKMTFPIIESVKVNKDFHIQANYFYKPGTPMTDKLITSDHIAVKYVNFTLLNQEEFKSV